MFIKKTITLIIFTILSSNLTVYGQVKFIDSLDHNDIYRNNDTIISFRFDYKKFRKKDTLILLKDDIPDRFSNVTVGIRFVNSKKVMIIRYSNESKYIDEVYSKVMDVTDIKYFADITRNIEKAFIEMPPRDRIGYTIYYNRKDWSLRLIAPDPFSRMKHASRTNWTGRVSVSLVQKIRNLLVRRKFKKEVIKICREYFPEMYSSRKSVKGIIESSGIPEQDIEITHISKCPRKERLTNFRLKSED